MNLELIELRNPEVIKAALRLDDLYKNIIFEDFEIWQPNFFASAFHYVFIDGNPVGIVMLERFCSNGIMFHGGIYEMFRHDHTPERVARMFEEIKDIYGQEKIIMTTCLIENKAAISVAKRAGLKEKCIINNASLAGDMMILSE